MAPCQRERNSLLNLSPDDRSHRISRLDLTLLFQIATLELLWFLSRPLLAPRERPTLLRCRNSSIGLLLRPRSCGDLCPPIDDRVARSHNSCALRESETGRVVYTDK